MGKDIRIIPSDGEINFTNAAGAAAGSITLSGDDLVLSNALGNVLFGDITSDVYIGDGINNVDIIFEKSGEIRAETGVTGVTLTIGSSNTTVTIVDPDLTGSPTAPTASAGTNTTQIATTAFVTGAVSNLVDSAPGTLNTLNELAAALGDDASFSTTIATSIGNKIFNNANDSFTGILTGTAAGENLKIGGIRGTTKGSQTGEYIHLYERVHVGGPSGWGAASHGAPASGLSTWGSVDFGMNGTGVIQLDGTTIVTAARALTNVTWDGSVIPEAKLQNQSGTNTGDQTTITGNAGSATVLQTARTINGVSFDGSANITVADSTKQPQLNGTGFVKATGTTISYDNSTYLTSVTNISGYAGTIIREDNRTISPSELTAGQLKFGFTSWANNNTAPYADFLHLRSYSDSSGGPDNLVMFKKSGLGMRLWQQNWGSATAYSSYVDVWTTGDFTSTNVSNWDTAYTHSQAAHAPSGATVNSTDAVLLARANHTGTQAYSTLSGTVPTWNQNTTGNAATVTTNANLTGHITSVGNAASLGSFTVAQLSTALSDATISGNNTGDQTLPTASSLGAVTLAGTQTISGQKFFNASFEAYPIMLSGPQNFDNIDRSGFYNLYNTQTGSTGSPGYSYGTMIAIGNDKGAYGFGFQLAHQRTGGANQLKVRGMNDSGTAWSAWNTVYTSADTIPYATSAGSAATAGNSETTDQKNFESLFVNDAAVATEAFVTGQSYLTSVAYSNITGTVPTWNQNTTGSAGSVGGYNSASLWKSDGGAWNPNANITLGQTANNQEWSFDITRNGYSGGYWHVWDTANSTMLKVDAVTGKVSAPYNFVGALEGNATTATTAGNAATATTLATARNINNVSFNGSSNIIIPTLFDAGYKTITNPGGGTFVTQVSTVSGAIAITLPIWTYPMMRMTIQVYEYTTNESFTISCGGHNSGTSWHNPFAYIVGNPGIDRRYTVRFGRTTAGLPVVYIGELASTWSYPQVFVTDVQVGYSGYSNSWTSGWSVGFVTAAFEGVSRTIDNSQVGYSVSSNTANSSVLRDGSGNFSAGTITATLAGNSTTATTAGALTSMNISQFTNNSGYLTAETDSQELTWSAAETKLTISGGNDVVIDGFLTDSDISGYGFVTGGPYLASTGKAADSELLDGYDYAQFTGVLARYGTTAGSGARIRITAPFNTNSLKMFSVDITIYAGYTQYRYTVSAYMYSTANNWHEPKALFSGDGSPDIYVGRDASGKAYISIANGNYTGVVVNNFVGGYYSTTADSFTPWVITLNNGTENSVSVSVIKQWNSSNDGSGSGLDADLLDGQQGSYYATAGDYLPLAGGVISGKIRRSSAITGFLEGSYNNVGANGTNTNPIYTIGSSYNPASTTLSNMYGVGFTSAGASFITNTGATDWGFYVAADGDARVWLDGSSGNISGTGNVYASGGNSTEWNTAYDHSQVAHAPSGATANSTDAVLLARANHTGTQAYSTLSGTVPTWNQNTTGNAATVTTNANLTGHITSVGNAAVLGSFTIAQLSAALSNATISGNNTGDQTNISGNAATATNVAYSGLTGTVPTWNQNTTGNAATATSATSATTATKLSILGYATDGQSFHQTSAAFAGYTGWANHFIANHGNGSTYYNTVHIMPFWAPPRYSRLESGVLRGPYTYWTEENLNPNSISGNFAATGTITAGGDITAYSDERLKTNIKTIENALDKTLKMRGVSYNRTDSDDKSDKVGVIAQEIISVLPEVVREGDDGMLSVSYGNIVGVLIEAIKEQQKQIDELKSRLNNL